MKNTIIFAAFAALTIITSCKKEPSVSYDGDLLFTATILDGTKTTINTDGEDTGNRGKIKWVAGDEITVTDADGVSVTYVTQGSGSTATFVKKEGETGRLASESTYSATYGTRPQATQSYSDYYKSSTQAQGLYMTAQATGGTNLKFTAAAGLLKLILTSSSDESDKTISKIEVTGTLQGESSDTTFVLTCSPAVDISSAATFYIALPAGSYNNIMLYNDKDSRCIKSAESTMNIVGNKIQPVTMTGLSFNIRPTLLPGKFSVSAQKKVYFTSGNLYWNGSYFNLETSQTAYPEDWDASHVGLFFWTKTAAESYAETCVIDYNAIAESDRFFADGGDAAHMLKVGGRDSLYVLSSDEWRYIFSDRTNASSLYKNNVTINGVAHCLVFAPDDFTGTIADSYCADAWTAAEAAGLVCLAPAGLRGGRLLNGEVVLANPDAGYYLSSSLFDEHNFFFSLAFYELSISFEFLCRRDNGSSLRLVSTAPPSVSSGIESMDWGKDNGSSWQ